MRPGLLVVCLLVALTGAREASAGQLPRTIGLHPPAGPALAMVDSQIEVVVRGPIVEATVTQRFVNKSDRATEATYVFPLPADAAVTAMAIKTGNRTIRAAIAKRYEAQRRYEEAVRAGVAAALLDQERPDVFTQTVAAIPARATVDITLRFDTLAVHQDGVWELVLPLVVAPRYVPGRATNQPTTGTGRAPDTDRAPDASRVTPGGAPGAGGKTQIVIAFDDPPTDLQSPTHALEAKGAIATLVDPRTDHDVIVRWRAASQAAGWVEAAPDGGYAAVVVEQPPAAPRKGTLRTLLVLDRSATSRGDADAVARPVVRKLLGALTAADRVAVTGSDRIAWSAPADVGRVLEAAWSTPAAAFDLTRVLQAARPDGAPLILVSSGLVADDRAAIAAAGALGVPIHVIGVGPAPARGLLVQLAAASGGTVRFAIPGDDLGAIVKAVLADAATPPAPLTVTWGTLAASEVVPGTLPRVGAGQATLVLARVKRAQTANARTRGDLFAIEVLPPSKPVDGATSALGPLARRWARNRLDELVHARASADVITSHAMKYGLVSPHTSMVAIGDEVVVQGGVRRSIAVPVSVPAGMKWQEVKQQTSVVLDAGVPEGRVIKQTKPEQPEREQGTKKKDAEGAPAKRDPLGDRNKDKNASPRRPQPSAGSTRLPVTDAPASEPRDRDGLAGSAAGADAVRDDEDDGEAVAAPKAVALAERTGEDYSEVVLSSAPRRGRWRIATALGGGVLRTGGANASLLSIGTRVELGITGRTLVGLDAALWLVDGEEIAGHTLVSVARLGLFRYLELGLGTGLAFGDGIGPAAAASLRIHLPPKPRAALYLRYDGALIFDQGTDARRQSTFTLGLEYGF